MDLPSRMFLRAHILRAYGLHSLAYQEEMDAFEARRQQRTLDEIVDDSAEDARLLEDARVKRYIVDIRDGRA